MTLIDMAIVIAMFFVFFTFYQQRETLKRLNLHLGAGLILSGLMFIALNYFADLVTMHVLPSFLPRKMAMDAMLQLHLNYSWSVMLIGYCLLAFGLYYLLKVLVPNVANLLRETSEARIFAENTTAELEARVEERTAEIVEQTKARRKIEDQLIQSSKLAALGEMATGIAHELNQPLNIIRMAAENMQEKIKDGDAYAKDKLDRIISQIDRAGTITDHLRVFGREDSEEFVPIDLKQAVLGAAGLIGEQLRLSEIEIAVDMPEICTKVMGHQIQFEQVVMNLLTNARDAIEANREEGDEPDRIMLRLENGPSLGKVRLVVQDTGGGIPKEKLHRIFDPFFTTKEVGVGTGLGLSISYGIITEMGGQIEAVNVDGGARFMVTMPTVIKEPDQV